MTDKPRWTRERKPKRRVVRAEVGKRKLREQLAAALAEIESLRFTAENAHQDIERLTKLTDYLRNGEVNIDEQERQFTELQREVERLTEVIETERADLVHAEAEVERLRAQVEDAEADVDEAKRRMMELQREVEGLRAPKACPRCGELVGWTRNALTEEVTPIHTDP